MSKLKELLKFWSTNGAYLPLAYDKLSNGPSITLLSVYVTLTLTSVAYIISFFKSNFTATVLTGVAFWALAVIFYLIRRISKADVDLKNQKIELENGDEASSRKTSN